MLKTIFRTIVCLLLSTSAYAGFSCTGQVTGVTMTPSGMVVIEKFKDWNWQYLCRVNTTYNGVDAESCKAILSLLMTAQTSKKDVSFWFNAGDCTSYSSQPNWTALSNWYYGPRLVN